MIGSPYVELLRNYIEDSVSNTISEGHYPLNYSIASIHTNHSNEYQVINYSFIPKIYDGRPGKDEIKCAGEVTDVNIYINPTPRISIAVDDTIYCNESSVEFIVNSSTTKILGELEFDVEAIPSIIGGITGSRNGATNLPLNNFSDDLTNNDTVELYYIDYTLHPKINSVPSSSTSSCGNGIPSTVRVYITPTLKTRAISLTRPTVVGGWDVKCFGDKTAQTTAKTIGGYVSVNGYTEDQVSYEWEKDDGDYYLTKTITQLGSGIYSVTATDRIGCKATSSIVVREPALLESKIDVIDNLVCEGDENGTMQALINGGTEGYSVTWLRLGTNPESWNTINIDSLIEGSYELYVTDTNQCKTYQNILLAPTSSVQVLTRNPDVFKGNTPASLNGYHIACFGGTLDSTVFIGKGDYDYELVYPAGDTNRFETDLTTVRNLPAGHYKLITTDKNNCQSVDSFDLIQPDPINIGDIEISGFDTFNISCYGEKDGHIHLNNITGGIDYNENTYIYHWRNPAYDSLSQYMAGIIQNNAHQNNLIAGTYHVNVKNGICELKDTFVLEQPEELIVNASIKSYSGGFNISCFDKSDGEINVDVSGGYIPYTGKYNYNWSNGGTDSIVTGLSAKAYTLEVTDDINCKTIKSYDLLQPEEMDINYTLSDYEGFNVRCFEGQGGSIEIFPSGGDMATYSYQWKALKGEGISETSKNQSGLTAGNYRIIVSDANSCIDSTTIELIEPEQLSILEIEKQNVSCDGRIKGFAEVMETGGAGSNTYLWSNGETTKRIDNLNALFFTVTVTDINDCQTVGSVQVEKTDSLNIELLPVEQYSGEVISCYGGRDGEIIAQVSYGQRPYSYIWSTGAEDSLITNLNQGRYDVTITDQLECKGTQTIYINQPSPIDAEINLTDVTCYNFSNGSIWLNTFGGAGPYTYNWLGAENSDIPSYENLRAGSYNVLITDANNCTKDTTFEVQQPTALSVDYDINQPFCPDMNDGNILANVKGGTYGYSYSWNTGDNSDFIDYLNENNYILTITDANHCELIDTVELKGEQSTCLDVPTAFTPNSDGFNDTWELVVSSDKYPQLPKVGDIYPNVTVEIYNRWGELIFVSENGYEEEWDGKDMKNGKDLPIDSYHYVIDIGDGRVKTGNVTIIR
jgi:gliding motility-associated-like protein